MKIRLHPIWTKLFGRPIFKRLNTTLIHLGLRGLGISNFESDVHSGEAWFVRQFLKSRLKGIERPVLFDVGANEGRYAKILIESFPTASIYCFEPHPRTFQRLVKATAGTPIERINSAVGSECGKTTLFDHASIPAGSEHATIIPSVVETVHLSESVHYEVPLITIDGYCRSKSIQFIDFLKIDVEGNEYAALLGASDMLGTGKIGIIQFEFNQMNIVSKVHIDDFFRVLSGYELWRLLPSSLLAVDRNDPFESSIFLFQNIIALPQPPPLSPSRCRT